LRHAPGGTHFCLLRRSEILPPWPLLRLADFCGAPRWALAKTGALLRVAVPCFCFGRRRALAKDRPLPLLRLACFVRWTRLGCAASRAFAASSTGRARRGCPGKSESRRTPPGGGAQRLSQCKRIRRKKECRFR